MDTVSDPEHALPWVQLAASGSQTPEGRAKQETLRLQAIARANHRADLLAKQEQLLDEALTKAVDRQTPAMARLIFEGVFVALQLDTRPGVRLLDWARDNPTQFYQLLPKLLPVVAQHEGNINLQVITGVPRVEPDTIEASYHVLSAPDDLEGIA